MFESLNMEAIAFISLNVFVVLVVFWSVRIVNDWFDHLVNKVTDYKNIL